jgi:hypothetical protein
MVIHKHLKSQQLIMGIYLRQTKQSDHKMQNIAFNSDF